MSHTIGKSNTRYSHLYKNYLHLNFWKKKVICICKCYFFISLTFINYERKSCCVAIHKNKKSYNFFKVLLLVSLSWVEGMTYYEFRKFLPLSSQDQKIYHSVLVNNFYLKFFIVFNKNSEASLWRFTAFSQ